MKKLLLLILCTSLVAQATMKSPGWRLVNNSDIAADFILCYDEPLTDQRFVGIKDASGEIKAVREEQTITLPTHVHAGKMGSYTFNERNKMICWDRIEIYHHFKRGGNAKLLAKSSFGALGICPPRTATVTLEGKNGKYNITVKRNNNFTL